MTVQISQVENFRSLGLLNEYNKARLNLAKYYFSHNVNLSLLSALYVFWRDTVEYGVIEKSWFNEKTCVIEHSYKAVKCSKRGNDVYRWRLKKRFDWIDHLSKKTLNLKFFDECDIKSGNAFTRMVFFTLTYDTKLKDRYCAWQDIGREFDNWMRTLRVKFGKLSVLRVWQSTIAGYPHIHGIALFQEKQFKIAYVQKDIVNGSVYKTYRLENHEEFSCGWHSFVDVCGVYNLRGAMNYARRYITKSNEEYTEEDAGRCMQYNSSQNNLDMSLMWLFSKRSFAVSGEFRSALSDLIRDMHNSEKGLVVQGDLDGHVLSLDVNIRWLGVFSSVELGIQLAKPPWVVDLDVCQVLKLRCLVKSG